MNENTITDISSDDFNIIYPQQIEKNCYYLQHKLIELNSQDNKTTNALKYSSNSLENPEKFRNIKFFAQRLNKINHEHIIEYKQIYQIKETQDLYIIIEEPGKNQINFLKKQSPNQKFNLNNLNYLDHYLKINRPKNSDLVKIIVQILFLLDFLKTSIYQQINIEPNNFLYDEKNKQVFLFEILEFTPIQNTYRLLLNIPQLPMAQQNLYRLGLYFQNLINNYYLNNESETQERKLNIQLKHFINQFFIHGEDYNTLKKIIYNLNNNFPSFQDSSKITQDKDIPQIIKDNQKINEQDFSSLNSLGNNKQNNNRKYQQAQKFETQRKRKSQYLISPLNRIDKKVNLGNKNKDTNNNQNLQITDQKTENKNEDQKQVLSLKNKVIFTNDSDELLSKNQETQSNSNHLDQSQYKNFDKKILKIFTESSISEKSVQESENSQKSKFSPSMEKKCIISANFYQHSEDSSLLDYLNFQNEDIYKNNNNQIEQQQLQQKQNSSISNLQCDLSDQKKYQGDVITQGKKIIYLSQEKKNIVEIIEEEITEQNLGDYRTEVKTQNFCDNKNNSCNQEYFYKNKGMFKNYDCDNKNDIEQNDFSIFKEFQESFLKNVNEKNNINVINNEQEEFSNYVNKEKQQNIQQKTFEIQKQPLQQDKQKDHKKKQQQESNKNQQIYNRDQIIEQELDQKLNSKSSKEFQFIDLEELVNNSKRDESHLNQSKQQSKRQANKQKQQRKKEKLIIIDNDLDSSLQLVANDEKTDQKDRKLNPYFEQSNKRVKKQQQNPNDSCEPDSPEQQIQLLSDTQNKKTKIQNNFTQHKKKLKKFSEFSQKSPQKSDYVNEVQKKKDNSFIYNNQQEQYELQLQQYKYLKEESRSLYKIIKFLIKTEIQLLNGNNQTSSQIEFQQQQQQQQQQFQQQQEEQQQYQQLQQQDNHIQQNENELQKISIQSLISFYEKTKQKEQLLKEEKEKYTSDFQINYCLAEQLLEEQQYSVAFEFCSELQKQFGHFFEIISKIQVLRSLIYQGVDNISMAIKAEKIALFFAHYSKKSSAKLWDSLAQLYQEDQQLKLAKECFKNAIDLDPDNYDYFYNKVLLIHYKFEQCSNQALNKLEKLIILYNQLSEHPNCNNHKDVYLNILQFQITKNARKDVLEKIFTKAQSKALELQDFPFIIQLAKLSIKMYKLFSFERATELLDYVIQSKQKSDIAEAYYYAGKLHIIRGKMYNQTQLFKQAIEYYRLAFENTQNEKYKQTYNDALKKYKNYI